MDLDTVDAVLELVVVPDGLGGKLAFLADRHEARAEEVCHGSADDEAPRLDRGDLGDPMAAIALVDVVDGKAQADRVFQERGDVAEHDPLLRVVRNRADE